MAIATGGYGGSTYFQLDNDRVMPDVPHFLEAGEEGEDWIGGLVAARGGSWRGDLGDLDCLGDLGQSAPPKVRDLLE